MNVGDVLKADVFAAGDKVDVRRLARSCRALCYGQHRLREATAPVLLLVMQVQRFHLPPDVFPGKRLPGQWALCASPMCRT